MPLPDSPADDCLAGGGEIAALMRSVDWSATPLGPVASWSLALRTMVRLLLVNRFQLFLWWGPRYVQFFNDAARPILGTKHPRSLGQPAAECWPEIWPVIGPLIDSPFFGGPASWQEDIFLEINRYGTPEETHFTIAYSPVPDDSVPGGIGGVFGTVHEITEKVVGERRVLVLRDLGAHAAEVNTAEEACGIAAKTLAAHDKDIPFSLIYLLDREGMSAELAAASGVAPGEAISPRRVRLKNGDLAGWRLPEVIAANAPQVVSDLAARFGTVPPGPWSDLPTTAVVLPIPSTKAHVPAGLLVAGVSARLRLDEKYRGFLELVAGQIGTAVANARAYEEERRRAEALAELDRAKTAFFSNVSHEFRTPLTLILGPVEDALADPTDPLPAGHRERLETAHRSSLRLLKLVNTLLDFSRIEAGRVQAMYEPTDLAALTAELASNFRSACERAGLRLVVDCSPLPEPVYVDRDMWEKVVLNLLSNAFKFTLKGEIAIHLRPTGGAAELIVRDTGTGIPADELPRIFERFHRVEGVRGRTHEGTGIGLALVQELVKLHGGTVRAESAYGQGSTFTVSVPQGAAHLPADRIGAARTHGSTALGARAFVEEALRWLPDSGIRDQGSEVREPLPAVVSSSAPDSDLRTSGERPRILWADDNADMRAYVLRLLGGLYDVEAVPDGETALAAARTRPPDLVLTDVMMPRLDGFGLLRELRADPCTRTIPVILLSARAGEESRIEGLQAGADDYLVKPFSARELLARVAAHLEVARVRLDAERRTAERLAESQWRFRAVFENSLDAILLMDDAGRYRDANPAACQLLGYDREELLGLTVADVTPGVDRGRIPELMRQFLAARTLHGEYALACKDGSTREVEYRAIANILSGLHLSVLRDITERKQAETALRESHALLRAVVEGMPQALFVKDRGGRYRLVNSPAARLIGKAVEEVIGRDDAALFDPETARQFVDADRRVMETGEAMTYEETGTTAGVTRTYLTTKAPFHGPDGEIGGVIGIARDITQRKAAEEELRRQKEVLQTIFDRIPVMINFVDPSGRVRLVSGEWERVMGWSLSDARGRDMIAEFYPDPDEQRRVREFVRNPPGGWADFKVRTRDGRVIDTSWANVLLSDGTSIGIGQDVTDRKKAEAERERLHREVAAGRAELEVLSRRLIEAQEVERAHLARELHDEIGQVLTTVNLTLESIRARVGPIIADRLDESRRVVDRAIEQVRSLSLDLRPASLDLLGLEPALRAYLARQAARAGLALNFSSSFGGERLPPTLETVCFRVVQEAATNVLRHARATRLGVDLSWTGEEVRVTIRDDGAGFDVAAAWERALRGEGFGLAGMRERVQLFGGRLDVESAIGSGTTIVVHFPVVGGSESPPH